VLRYVMEALRAKPQDLPPAEDGERTIPPREPSP